MTPAHNDSDQQRPEIVYGKRAPEISYSAEHGVLTINGCKISIEFLQHITASEPGIRFRVVERTTDGAITISQERSEIEAAAPDMLAALNADADDLEYLVNNISANEPLDEAMFERIATAWTRARAAVTKATGVPR